MNTLNIDDLNILNDVNKMMLFSRKLLVFLNELPSSDA